MVDKRTRREFERTMLPHLASAHHLALWLLRHPHDTEDAVQDAFLKAFKAFDTWGGDNAAAWLLKIVHNTCMTRLKKRSLRANVVHLDAVPNDDGCQAPSAALADTGPLPEAVVITSAEQRAVRHAVRQLPADFCEVIVLREFEGLSYRQISEVTDVPIGTVMSRLSRARRQLRDLLNVLDDGGRQHEV